MISAARDKAASGPSGAADGSSASVKPHRKRVRNFTADDRAAHRIFEKNRRESFRERLNDLAKELPALAGKNPQRLSKHTVLDESIARHRFMQTNCLDAIQSMKALVQERDELLAEVNTWRNASGLAERQPKDVDMNSEKLGSLEKAIHMNPSDSSPGCTSQSPDSELGPKNVEDGKQAGFATQPQCSPLTTFIAATQGAHNDMSNPFPLSTGFHEDLSLGTMSLPLNADSHSVFPHNPQLGPNTLLLDAPGIRGGGEDSAMAIKQPQCDITGSDKPELQIGHQLAYTIHDELAAQRSLLDGEGLMTTEGCDLEFPVSMATPIDFNTELVLQRNPSWAF